jgi:hypothetical protein
MSTWQMVGQFRDNLNYQLRNDDEYHIPRHGTDQLAGMPLFNLPRLWNQYSCELTETPIKHMYSKAITVPITAEGDGESR